MTGSIAYAPKDAALSSLSLVDHSVMCVHFSAITNAVRPKFMTIVGDFVTHFTSDQNV